MSCPRLIIIRLLLLAAISSLSFGCSTTNGPDGVKSPRNYSWDVTNLSSAYVQQPILWSVWGSSSSDVYSCGRGTGYGIGSILHYDGRAWNALTIPLGDGLYYELNQITGFARDNIWAVGNGQYARNQGTDSAVVLHFDGSKWTNVLSSPMGVAGLRRIFVLSPTDIYCGSGRGQVMHYDGIRWTVELLYPGLSINAIGGDRDRVFISGNTYKGTLDDSVLCYTKTSGSWQLVDVRTKSRFMLGFYTPSQNNYFAGASDGILTWQTNRWDYALQNYNWFDAITGTGQNDILAVGQGQSLPTAFHFDGYSWAEIGLPSIPSRPGLALTSIWMDDREAFILGNDGNTSFVIHGK